MVHCTTEFLFLLLLPGLGPPAPPPPLGIPRSKPPLPRPDAQLALRGHRAEQEPVRVVRAHKVLRLHHQAER